MKSTKPFLKGIQILSIALLSLTFVACHTVNVIDGNKQVLRLPKAEPFTPSIDGYFVPDARMREILHELETIPSEDP